MKRHVRPALVAIFAALPVLFVLSAISAQPQQADPPKPSFTGKVVSVADGDTITVLLDKTQHRIRLEGIDCPESHQDFGTAAKKAIADKVFGKEVTIKWTSRDKYKRILGEVYLGNRRINLEIVQEGFAWHYTQYSKDQTLANAEKEAKEAKRGLWSMPNPIPPWEYRKGKKGDAPPDAADALFVTSSGSKYHRVGCRSLSKSKIPISLDDARKRYQPCSVCSPPK